MHQPAILNDNNCRWNASLAKKGSKQIYVRLFYMDKVIVRTTGLPWSDTNINKAQVFVDKINLNLASGTFRYESAFPKDKRSLLAYFARMEGRTYKPTPESVTFAKCLDLWYQEHYPTIKSTSTRRDYDSAIDAQIKPFFEHFTVAEITESAVKRFFLEMKCKVGGQERHASDSRMRNILSVLRNIYDFSRARFDFQRQSPLDSINKYITTITSGERIEIDANDPDLEAKLDDKLAQSEDKHERVIHFSNFLSIIDHYDERLMRLAAELMFLTGMSPSESGALTRSAASGTHIDIKLTYSRGAFQTHAKNKYRIRRIPITAATRRVLDEAMAISSGPLIFRSPRGKFFNERTHRTAWYKACAKSGVERINPYCSRHSFVAYCEVMGVSKPRIVALMGHADKSMVDRVYGKYREGLEKDRKAMQEYYGKDFWKS